MVDRYSKNARILVRFAECYAWLRGDDRLRTEYLLVGYMLFSPETAAIVLGGKLGPLLSDIKSEIEKSSVQWCAPTIESPELFPDSDATAVFRFAWEEARQLDHPQVEPDHILLGVLRVKESLGAQILLNIGLKFDEVRERILRLQKEDSDPWELLTQRLARETEPLHGRYLADTSRVLIVSLATTDGHIPFDLLVHGGKNCLVRTTKANQVRIELETGLRSQGINVYVWVPRARVDIVTVER